MSKLVELVKIIEQNKAENDQRTLDAKASYTVLENCVKFLDMNNMPELEAVKLEIRKTMKELKDIGKNGEEKQKAYRKHGDNTAGNC